MYLGNGRGAWLAGCYVHVQQLCGQPGVPAARILRSTPLGHIPERLHKGNVRRFNMSCLNFVFRNKKKFNFVSLWFTYVTKISFKSIHLKYILSHRYSFFRWFPSMLKLQISQRYVWNITLLKPHRYLRDMRYSPTGNSRYLRDMRYSPTGNPIDISEIWDILLLNTLDISEIWDILLLKTL